MKLPLIMLTLVMVMLAGLLMGRFIPFVQGSQNGDSDASARVAGAAVAYYSSLNELLETGDPAAFRQALHPDFVDESDPDSPVTADLLVDELLVVARNSPGVQVTATQVVAEGSVVVSQLAIVEPPSESSTGVSIAYAAPMSGYEFLRIEDGKVIERIADPALPAPGRMELVASAVLDLAVSPQDLYLSRAVLQRFDRSEFENPGGAVLIVQSGGGEAGVRPGNTDTLTTSHVSGSLLVTGDTLVVPIGSSFWLANQNMEPFSVLIVAFAALGDSGAPQLISVENPENEPIVRLDVLAYGPAADVQRGNVRIDARQIELLPGSQIAPHDVESAEIALVLSGSVEVVITDGHARHLGATGTVVRRSVPFALAQDESIALDADASVAYVSHGIEPAVLLLITGNPMD